MPRQQPSPQQVNGDRSQESPQAKIGTGHAAAMFRAGLKEISQILPAFPDSVKPAEEMGLAGNALPQEVFQDRHQKEPNIEQNLEMQM